ncbi:MAG: methyltransferase domain-containing protein [Rhodobacterales bacterium]|nr:methyltransferase domain-containing protein [Rhodobacterales bacterium]
MANSPPEVFSARKSNGGVRDTVKQQSGAGPRSGFFAWRNRLVASRRFQSWASRLFLTRGVARREGEALFDLVSGFAQSQVLFALVELRVLHLLLEQAETADAMAARLSLPPDRARVLLHAGVALGLLSVTAGRYRTAQRGAALLGVPGLEAMISHHDVLYRDLADPVAFFRGETETELARFWPYVFGAGGAVEPAVTARYSDLMADSQGLVAEETLRTVSLAKVRHLMDVGGGSGAFLTHVAEKMPKIGLSLFDLPVVAPTARARFVTAGIAERVTIIGGSFRDDALPCGADAISLIRVLYDHSDATVRALLSNVYRALPDGGRLIVSEPMSGGAVPNRPGDVYFALYCMAMRTGRARSADEIATLLGQAGFSQVRVRPTSRPFVTSIVECVRD